MADINSIIQVTVSINNPAVTRIGFGEPLIFSRTASAVVLPSERVRRYSSSTGLSDMVTDGFSTDDPAYLAAAAITAQSPRPPTFKVAGGDSDFTLALELTPKTFVSGETLEFVFTKGTTSRTYTRTAAGGSLAAEATAIAALMNADASGWGTAGTGELTIAGVGNAVEIDAISPGNDNELWYVSSVTNISVKDVTADRGMAADLAVVIAADADWYALVLADSFGAAEIAAAAGWVQSQTNKILVAQTQDSEVVDAGTGIGATLSAANRDRTYLIYSAGSMSEHPSGAAAGRFLPESPGSEIWAFKSLSGVTPSTLTTAQASNAASSYVNTYTGVAIGGVSVVQGNAYAGWSSGSSETYIDTIRLIDAVVAEVQTELLSLFRASRKVPYTDQGIGQVKGTIVNAVRQFVPQGFTEGSVFCEVPSASDISAAIKATRTLPNVVFGATFAGAIRKVTIQATFQY